MNGIEKDLFMMMKQHIVLWGMALMGMLVLLAQVVAQPGSEREGTKQHSALRHPNRVTLGGELALAGATIGPDVIVSTVDPPRIWGQADGIIAYSVGGTACNIGDEILSWRAGTLELLDNRHPVIAQNLFRLKDGRLEQLGQSWLKHAFCAADAFECGACLNPQFSCDWLGVGCSDPYVSFQNGFQGSLGPKHEVDPVTGVFPVPPADPAFSGVIARRLQVLAADIDPNARYFFEVQYISSDDAAAGNELNNVSYREVFVSFMQTGQPQTVESFVSPTVVSTPNIMAWEANDPSVSTVIVDVPGDGRFYIASKSIDLGDGTWQYEYAVYNMNSDRAAQSFSIPVAPGINIITTGFRDVNYHSGEIYSNDDWLAEVCAGELIWQTDRIEVDSNANALRWGTMYNFWFIADAAPSAGSVRTGLFKPGSPASIFAAVTVPAGTPCPSDCSCPGDGEVDVFDLLVVLGNWNGAGVCDINRDGVINVLDLLILLGAWGVCP